MDAILVIDDEPAVHDVLGAYLEHNGFEVLHAYDGREGLQVALSRQPALVVLDLGLPDMGGEHVAAQLRGAGDMPIIMLTARSSEDDRIIGLDLGADDYVNKPYSPRELVARVKAVLRRRRVHEERGVVTLQGGRLRLDPERHEVSLDGHVLPLTPAEHQLLAGLAARPGRAYSRLELVERISGNAFAGYERTVDAHVKNLRRKLGPEAGGWIETVRGVGYRLEAKRP